MSAHSCVPSHLCLARPSRTSRTESTLLPSRLEPSRMLDKMPCISQRFQSVSTSCWGMRIRQRILRHARSVFAKHSTRSCRNLPWPHQRRLPHVSLCQAQPGQSTQCRVGYMSEPLGNTPRPLRCATRFWTRLRMSTSTNSQEHFNSLLWMVHTCPLWPFMIHLVDLHPPRVVPMRKHMGQGTRGICSTRPRRARTTLTRATRRLIRGCRCTKLTGALVRQRRATCCTLAMTCVLCQASAVPAALAHHRVFDSAVLVPMRQ